jgi:hypothetical protein
MIVAPAPAHAGGVGGYGGYASLMVKHGFDTLYASTVLGATIGEVYTGLQGRITERLDSGRSEAGAGSAHAHGGLVVGGAF